MPGNPDTVAAAATLQPLFDAFLGGPPPVTFQFWDGSRAGPTSGPERVVFRNADAIRRIAWAPDELGFGRAYVVGDIELEGDPYKVMRAIEQVVPHDMKASPKAVAEAVRAAKRLGVLRWPPPPPAEEAHARGRRHSRARDRKAITHHYDVGNDFYRLMLGPSMTYSCARFEHEDSTLEEAQASKHDLICRKLGLDRRPGMRLLDVGCGWGSLAMHAARYYEADVVGITISSAQAELGRKRVADAGLAGHVEIRLQDYRDLDAERFDAVSSVGMFEHVGRARMAGYFAVLHRSLRPHGRLLNHAISTPGGSRLGRRRFVGRYVFPDGELQDVGDVVVAMQQAGFEVRDVESLREHYAETLRHWVANLDAHWDEAVAEVGLHRARIWRIYMVGSVLGFEDAGLSVHQVLGAIDDEHGGSGLPRTRATLV
jgi:cyclopropane-fatty-acyl-phospholipid synthase